MPKSLLLILDKASGLGGLF